VEEIFIRRELADNFCYYEPEYNSVFSFWDWAKETLKMHNHDKREFEYSLNDFDNHNTKDDLWNHAQIELKYSGVIHGYVRMYWAKKILEWTDSFEKAFSMAIYLNDKYALDGRESNGYASIAWSIGGVHDRPWPEREVYGKIRCMKLSGCKKKFNIDSYINRVKKLTDSNSR
jgi:deoxyribodipyrimidine photo-lyase